MKMCKWYSVITLLVLLVSCMGQDEDKQTFGGQLGVIQEEPELGVCLWEGDVIYSPALDTMALKAGDCCLLNYTIDHASKESLPGYSKYRAEILKYEPVPVFGLSPNLTDTTRILDNECFISFSLQRSMYLKNRFFLFTEHGNYVDGQTTLFELTYNPKQEATIDRNNNRVYNLYLRTATAEDMTGMTGSRYTLPIALDLEKFVKESGEIEKNAGLDSLKFKFNYPRSFNSDTTACIWTSSDMVALPINE
ncbi:BFO_2992 family lipoprotein [Parabacteroides chinchillae]|uniref:NigD-like OB domain-containing protein n=1 Tax=Parabacteroides chinchillae TaxID=871327 RepID=A0A8G2F5Z6_9BACT|nr:hypothetical protein [Parabacteroides chinchillae]SEG19125.1 hypothetical protein SAMN05444001_11927 [Parabacteroides chinchillae]